MSPRGEHDDPPAELAATTVLVVGATGSIGRLVVEEAIRAGHTTRALVRDRAKAQQLPAAAAVVVGDVTRPETLAAALDGVDAIVLTHGSSDDGTGAEAVDYGGVLNVLNALGERPVRIVLMTGVGVTNRAAAVNQANGLHDWKRRSERLVRASGRPYTVVRPGWFDYNGPDEHRLAVRQGDTRTAGDSSDGAVGRGQLAEVLVRTISSVAALGKTFELVVEAGPQTVDFDALFGSLQADPAGTFDGARDVENMLLQDEPRRVRDDLAAVQPAERRGGAPEA